MQSLTLTLLNFIGKLQKLMFSFEAELLTGNFKHSAEFSLGFALLGKYEPGRERRYNIITVICIPKTKKKAYFFLHIHFLSVWNFLWESKVN